VYAIVIPIEYKKPPSRAFFEYSAVSAIPATAVGNANGISTNRSITPLPKKVYRASVHATTIPNTKDIKAAINEQERLTYTALKMCGLDNSNRREFGVCPTKIVASGNRTKILRYRDTSPKDRPNPGSGE